MKLRKHTKSVFGILLALAMVVTTVLPVLAVPDDDFDVMPMYHTGEGGSITLNAPKKADSADEYVDLNEMTVKAYLVLETDNEVTNASNLFEVTSDFANFFAAVKTAFYDGDYVKDGKIVSEADMYLTYDADAKALKLETDPPSGEFIKIKANQLSQMIAINEDNHVYFESALMAAVLTDGVEVEGSANAANGKLFAEWLRRYAVARGISATKEVTVEEAYDPKTQQQVEIGGLEFGYWLLVSENTPADVANVEAIFKLVKDEANQYVNMKLEKQDLDKQVRKQDDGGVYGDDTTAGVGDILNYKVTTKLPDLTDYDGSHLASGKDPANYEYKFEDTLHNQWLVNGDDTQVPGAESSDTDFTQGVFAVTITMGDKSVTLKDIPDEGFDAATWGGSDPDPENLPLSYFLKEGGASTYGTYGSGTQKFVLDFDVKKLRELELNEAAFPSGWKEAQVTVTYNAELTSDAALQNNNDVMLEYSNDPNTTAPKQLKDETQVYTYGFALAKKFEGYEGKDPGEGLRNGVTFKLHKAKNTGSDVVLEEPDEVITVTGSDGNYVKADSSAKGASPDLKLSSTGSFSVYGLDEGYYILEETDAPAGYAKIKEIVVYIRANKTVYTADTYVQEGDVSILKDGSGFTVEDGTKERNLLEFEVTNYKGMNLPDTGGAGVWLLLIGGVMLITLAGALMMNHKKHNTAK